MEELTLPERLYALNVSVPEFKWVSAKLDLNSRRLPLCSITYFSYI